MSLNYVMLGSNDVAEAFGFYDALLPAIGGSLTAKQLPEAFCYELRDGGRIWVATPFNERAAMPGNGPMVGLLCRSRAEVDTAHRIALDKGGTDEGKPGPRPRYGPDFYGAYLRDLDGNKMSLVHFGS